MDTHLRALVEDVIEQGQRMRDNWNCWDIETRHDAVNEWHTRWQDADFALMDAVRLTDFTAGTDTPTADASHLPAAEGPEGHADAPAAPTTPPQTTEATQPAQGPVQQPVSTS